MLRILTACMSAMFLASVESTIVATAAPTIVDDLGGLNLLSWVFTAYMLATTVSAALWGKLSDLLGRQRTFLAALTLFVAGSLLAGLARDMPQLIMSRGLQGIGGGGLTAIAFIVMADILPPRKRGRYVGFMSATYAAGSVIGPMVGGALVDAFGWRSIFLLNLPLGAMAGAVAARALRGVGGRRKARLDLAGAVTLSGTIVCVLLAGVWGGDTYAWSSPTIIGLFAVAIALAALFVLAERRASEPVLALRLLGNRTLVVSVAIAALTTVPFNAAAVYLPLFLQTVRGASVSGSGVQLAPLMVAMSVASIVTGRRVSVTGRYRTVLVAGLVLGAAGSVSLATIDAGTTTGTVMLMMVVLGFGFGMSSPVVNLTAQNAMPVEDLGAASSAMLTLRSLGGTLGIGVVGTILLTRLRSNIASIPAANDLDASSIASGPETIRALDEPLRSDVVAAMADAVGGALAIGVVISIVALLLAWLLPEHPLRDQASIQISESAV